MSFAMFFAYLAFFAFHMNAHGPRIDEPNGKEHPNERLALRCFCASVPLW